MTSCSNILLSSTRNQLKRNLRYINILSSSYHSSITTNSRSIVHNHSNLHKRYFVGPVPDHFSHDVGETETSMRRPSIRIGGPAVDLSTGVKAEPGEKGRLPWEPIDIHPEKPPPGYMNIEGFFDGAIQIDGKKYNESLFIMPQFITSWKVKSLEEITVEHMALPTIHYPAIRHVFIGCGYTMLCPTPIELIDYMAQFKITVEICALATAVRLFNMQNTLYQNFACALIYDEEVTQRLHNITRKVDLGMKDPMDEDSTPGSDDEDWYHKRVKFP